MAATDVGRKNGHRSVSNRDEWHPNSVQHFERPCLQTRTELYNCLGPNRKRNSFEQRQGVSSDDLVNLCHPFLASTLIAALTSERNRYRVREGGTRRENKKEGCG